MEKGISRRTVYWSLQQLKAAGLAEEKDGRWYWYEFLKREFTSEEYKLVVEHSKELCEMLSIESLLEEPLEEEKRLIRRCLWTHLKAYPKLLKLFDEYRAVNGELNRERAELKRRFELEAKKAKIPSIPPSSVAVITLESLKDQAEGREPFYKRAHMTEHHAEGIVHRFGAYFLKAGTSPSELIKFVERCIRSKRNLELAREFLKLLYEQIEKETKLRRELIRLKLLVEHGVPLEGRCEICFQFIRIKAPSEGGA
jgi:hypothetical protein